MISKLCCLSLKYHALQCSEESINEATFLQTQIFAEFCIIFSMSQQAWKPANIPQVNLDNSCYKIISDGYTCLRKILNQVSLAIMNQMLLP